MSHRLFCFGYSYTARFLAERLRGQGFAIAGTRRAPAAEPGVEILAFDGAQPLAKGALHGTTHLLVSIPPDEAGDPVLRLHAGEIAELPGLRWIGYLSTTGVYGDRQGGWVDEASEVAPLTERARRRIAAEAGWRALPLPAHVFRLAGIYGPGRSTLDQVREGRAQRIVKPGQYFSRIHVADIAAVLAASIAKADPGAVYNVCDDEPAATADVVAFACRLLGREPPPEIPFEAAVLSPMARSFYGESRRVRNDRIKRELGIRLAYPTYREGLRALLAAPSSG